MAKISRFLMITGLLFVAAALFITIFNVFYDSNGKKTAEAALDTLQDGIADAQKENSAILDAARRELSAKGREEIATENVVRPDFVLDPDMEMPTVQENGRDYIGLLEIPTLELSLPVISEWSYPNLRVSPCRYVGTAYRNNLVIAAHNYQSHFGRLKELNCGDALTFTDAVGNMFAYQVIEVITLQPTAVEEMQTGDWDLTLFTCTVGGRARVTVRCELTEITQSGSAD